MARLINLAIIALELMGLSISVRERGRMIFVFYTQLSNLLTVVASAALVIFGQPEWVGVLRYTSVCMLVMTALVTCLVLVPMGGDPHQLLWSGNGIYHHVICPALSTASYVLIEKHVGGAVIVVPVLLTLVYGLTMLWLNARRVVDGPYPFFKVHEQSVRASVLWTLILLLVITVISLGVLVTAR